MRTAIGSGVNLEQREMLLERARQVTEKIMTQGEAPIEIAVQQKPFFNFLPNSVVVTNKRVILHQPGFLKATFRDFLWKDLQKVHLTDKVFGSQLVFEFASGSLIATHLPKNQAKKVYSIAQAREEEWVEKWRLRRIEEERAKSGANHIVVGSSGSGGSGEGIKGIKERLLELESLREEGLITQDEYQNKKMEILELV